MVPGHASQARWAYRLTGMPALKDRYRESPGAALLTLRAQGTIGEGVNCKRQTGKALVQAGLHPARDGKSATKSRSAHSYTESMHNSGGVLTR